MQGADQRGRVSHPKERLVPIERMADAEKRAEGQNPDEKRECCPPGSIDPVIGREEATSGIDIGQGNEKGTHQTTVEKHSPHGTIDGELLQVLPAPDHAVGGRGKAQSCRHHHIGEGSGDESNQSRHQGQGEFP